MSTAVNTVKESTRSVITLLGSKIALENNLGITPNYDTSTTINSLYNVFPTMTPSQGNRPTEQYFGVGIGGDYYSGTSNLMNPQELSATNMNLYKHIPLRAVPIEQDLTGSDRDQYRMRSVETRNGRQYVCYYLKKIVFANSQVQYGKYDPILGSDQPYSIDPSNLNPKPPATPVDGATTNLTEEITASISANLPILGSEIIEVINVLYGGDMRYARISELGIYTGVDQLVDSTDSKGNKISYTEAIYAQLAQAHTFLGKPFISPNSIYNPSVKLTSGNMCVAQNDLAGS